jgi:hypothetical protein
MPEDGGTVWAPGGREHAGMVDDPIRVYWRAGGWWVDDGGGEPVSRATREEAMLTARTLGQLQGRSIELKHRRVRRPVT